MKISKCFCIAQESDNIRFHNMWESVKDNLVHAGQCLVGGALPVVGGLTLYGANAHAPNLTKKDDDGRLKKRASQLNAEERAELIAYTAKDVNLEIIEEENTVEPLPAVRHEPTRDQAVNLQGNAALRRACLVLGDTQILDSSFEGGVAEDAVIYWKKVIEQEDKNLDTFLESGEKRAIFADFEDMRVSADLLVKGKSKELVGYIYKRLEERGRFVLTLRTQSTEGPGHVFGAVFEKKRDGSVSFYFLNKGEGSELFPELSIGEKPRASYRSATYILDRRLFSHEDEKFDELLVKKWIGFTREKPTRGEWNSTSLETLLFAVSKPDKTQKMKISDEATRQHSGICSDELARLIIRDQLLQKSHGQRTSKQMLKYKRVIASGKMEAIKLLASIQGPYKLVSKLLTVAAHSFIKAFVNQRITASELQFVKQLISDVKLRKPSLGVKLPKIEEKEDSLPISFGRMDTMGSVKDGGYLKNEENFVNFHALTTLKAKIEGFRNIDNSSRLCLMRTLPIPVPGQANPEWDALTEQEKETFISELRVMNVSMDWQEKEVILFNLQSLVIGDYLTRNMPSVHREGFSINPLLEGMQHKLDLQYGDTALRFEKLCHYFREVNVKAGQSDLFAFTNLSEKELNDNLMSCSNGGWGVDSSVRTLYNYLLQFKEKITDFNTETGQIEKERISRLIANYYSFSGTKTRTKRR